MADFIDAFVISEAEEVALELLALLKSANDLRYPNKKLCSSFPRYRVYVRRCTI